MLIIIKIIILFFNNNEEGLLSFIRKNVVLKKCKEEKAMIEKLKKDWINDLSNIIDDLRNKKITKTKK
jgi:hypothetical protein